MFRTILPSSCSYTSSSSSSTTATAVRSFIFLLLVFVIFSFVSNFSLLQNNNNNNNNNNKNNDNNNTSSSSSLVASLAFTTSSLTNKNVTSTTLIAINTTTAAATTATAPKKITYVYYTKARKDRSGSFIYDMIAALAYVYNLNNIENSNNDNDDNDNDNKVEYVYGGACGGSGGPNTQLLFSQHRKLINAIGLDEVFKITNRYPQGIVKQKDIRISKESNTITNTNINNIIMSKLNSKNSNYTQTEITQDFLIYLRSLAVIRKIDSNDHEQQDKDQQDQGEVDMNYDTTTNNNKYKVVVHIRRGDVTPCMTGPPTRSNKIKISRYTPNILFLNVLQQIIEDNKTYGMIQPNEVTIFSSTSSTIQQYENFTIFEKLGYNIEINGPIENVWKRISSPATKIVILSKSSFSYVPALLASDNATTNTTTKIIYTPFWMEAPTTTTTTTTATNRSSGPLWDVVDQQILNDAEVKMKELRSKFCGSAK